MSVHIDQLRALTDFLENNKELALGRLARSMEGRCEMRRLWGLCADILNGISPEHAQKSADQWRMYYNELKSKLLKKIKLQKCEVAATGGGPSKTIILTPLQERLYTILGRDVGEPLPGVRHDPLLQEDQNVILELVEDASHPAFVRTPSLELDEFIRQLPDDEIVSLEVPAQNPSTSSSSGSQQLAYAPPPYTPAAPPLTPTSPPATPAAWSATPAAPPAAPAAWSATPAAQSAAPAAQSATPAAQSAAAAAPRRRRRRRRSSPNRATDEEPHMREATARLHEMERLSAEATHAHARAIHRLAAALEVIGERLRGPIRVTLDPEEVTSPPVRRRRVVQIYSSESESD